MQADHETTISHQEGVYDVVTTQLAPLVIDSYTESCVDCDCTQAYDYSYNSITPDGGGDYLHIVVDRSTGELQTNLKSDPSSAHALASSYTLRTWLNIVTGDVRQGNGPFIDVVVNIGPACTLGDPIYAWPLDGSGNKKLHM